MKSFLLLAAWFHQPPLVTLISPYHISPESNIKVRRIKELMIAKKLFGDNTADKEPE